MRQLFVQSRLFLIFAAIVFSVQASWPQDENDAPPAAATEEPAANDQDAAEEGAAEKDDAEAGVDPTAADFEQMFKDWNSTIEGLEKLAGEFPEADADRKKEIRDEYIAAVTNAEKLLPRLVVAAEKKLLADKDPEGDEAGILAEYLAELLRRDDYEAAQKLSETLVDQKVEDQSVLEDAGTAAFMLSDFDTAEARYKAAAEKGPLSADADRHQSDLDYYKKIWEQEQAFRKAEAEADDLPRVRLTTSKGDIVIELFENEAPNTVANFISLVEKGYYDGLTFHRVLPGFMAQGGDPTGTGSGGPGYRIKCECVNDVHRNHFRGTLSMAHAGRDTGGSQFFLTFVPTKHLDGMHTVFGRVIEGFDVLPKLQRRDPNAPNPPEPDKIIKAEVIRKRDHEYKPETLPEN